MTTAAVSIRSVLLLLLVLGALGFTACGDEEEDATSDQPVVEETTEAETTTETEETTTDAAGAGGSEAGNPEARAKEIVACLEGEGFEALQNSGNDELGEDASLVVGGGISIIHVYSDESAASEGLAAVEREAASVGPVEVEAIGDVVVEIRTSSGLDADAIEESRTAATTCVTG